jgi:hypothetical protein
MLIGAEKCKPSIDRECSLKQTAEAQRYVETAGKRGNIAVTAAK